MSNYLIFNKIKNYLNTLRLQTEKNTNLSQSNLCKSPQIVNFKVRYWVCHHYR